MKKKSTMMIALIAIAVHSLLWAQKDSINRQSIFLELGGIAGTSSINYERIIPLYKNTGINVGIGFSPSLFYNGSGFSPRLPLRAKFYYKAKRHIIDLGAAFTLYIWPDNQLAFRGNITNVQLAIFGQVGYKYIFKQSHFYIGSTFTPLLWDARDFEFKPWGGIQFGYNFKQH